MRINVGCGATPTPGWLNIDNSVSVRLARLPAIGLLLPANKREFVRAVRRHGVRHGIATRLPAPSGCAEVVYSSHMLEHLDRKEARLFLSEARRVLAVGGKIRLVVPDIRRKAEAYLQHGDADAFVHDTLMGTDRPTGLGGWLRHVFVGPRHHLWMYDGRSLAALLADVGFVDAIVLPAGQTTIPDPGGLDLSERSSESVYVEATAA